jgi:hypothetical protein
MDLKQIKLSRSEWDSIEIPVSDKEKDILHLIINGFHNVNIKVNNTNSLFKYLKIEYTSKIEDYLYNKYFSEIIKSLIDKYKISFIKINDSSLSKKHSKEKSNTEIETTQKICYINVNQIVKLKSTDQIRVGRYEAINSNNSEIYEFILIDLIEKLFKKKSKQNPVWVYYYYTISKLIKNSIENLNVHISNITHSIIENLESEIELSVIIEKSIEFIEKNENLLKYSDLTLYEHQKEIFTLSKISGPKLILYIAPTGTGKTLTPIGLSESKKIIFVCAARHVGLALAKAAISVNKKIAIAFGCSSADDIRLHYFAAKEYTVNKRSGKIQKVDNSIGDKVEIMICDIRSYLPAMYYMLAFNKPDDVITYWDEPTISLDYEDHDLHKIIQQNWKKNIIPNMVLSSATLPKLHELSETIADFNIKFPSCKIFNIESHDCRKTIPLIDNNGYVVTPHCLSEEYDDILKTVLHCEENLSLLRYLDLKETSDFIIYVEKNNYVKSSSIISRSFSSVNDIDMKSIKMHYLKVLKNIKSGTWGAIYTYHKMYKTRKIVNNTNIDSKGNILLKTNSIGPGITQSRKLNGEPITRLSSEQIVNPTEQQELGSNGNGNGNCAIYVTTKDAYTLTDGPTIFLANDVQKIAKFCIQQANIPTSVMKDIIEKIEFNNKINESIDDLESKLEFAQEGITNRLTGDNTSLNKKDKKNKTKIAGKIIDKAQNGDIIKIKEELDTLKKMIKTANLNDLFVPNKLTHLKKWAYNIESQNPFTSDVDEETIASIMLLKDVEDSWKVLLLLGIGVFT